MSSYNACKQLPQNLVPKQQHELQLLSFHLKHKHIKILNDMKNCRKKQNKWQKGLQKLHPHKVLGKSTFVIFSSRTPLPILIKKERMRVSQRGEGEENRKSWELSTYYFFTDALSIIVMSTTTSLPLFLDRKILKYVNIFFSFLSITATLEVSSLSDWNETLSFL